MSIELRLKPSAGRRVLAGHPWAFSNEIVPPERGAFAPGDPVVLLDADGRFVGRGFGHPGTLIAARIATRDAAEELDIDWLRRRLTAALELRARLAPGRRSFRWAFGDADRVPGVVLDRFEDRVVGSLNTASAERLRPTIEAVLREEFGIRALLWRNDARGRELEGLPDEVVAAWGVDGDARWTIDDGGVDIGFRPVTGQKTGYFLDMWANRRAMVPLLARGRVLDLFSYVGGWGLHASQDGADEVVCVDTSEPALAECRASAERNGLADRVRTERGDVLDFLRAGSGVWDAVICDPPAFVPNRKALPQGTRAYEALFAAALRAVRPGGMAVLASCSYHVDDSLFAEIVLRAARKARREAVVVRRGEQSPCHPVPLAFPEARYLKCWLLAVR